MANHIDIGRLDDYFEEIRYNNPTIDRDIADILRSSNIPMSVGQIRLAYESVKGIVFPIPEQSLGIPIAAEFLRTIPDVFRYQGVDGSHFMLYE